MLIIKINFWYILININFWNIILNCFLNVEYCFNKVIYIFMKIINMNKNKDKWNLLLNNKLNWFIFYLFKKFKFGF